MTAPLYHVSINKLTLGLSYQVPPCLGRISFPAPLYSNLALILSPRFLTYF
jgi:hypothetical protein